MRFWVANCKVTVIAERWTKNGTSQTKTDRGEATGKVGSNPRVQPKGQRKTEQKFRELGYDGEAVSPEKLREMMLRNGIDPEACEFTRAIIEERER